MKKRLIVIPAYNESGNILNTIRDIEQNCPKCDYIVINDGSVDDTAKVLQQNNIPHITLLCNLGIGGAIQMGYIYARDMCYDTVIQFDGDGQHSAKFIDKLCKSVENGSHLAVGSRYIDKTGFQSTFMRRVGIKYFSQLIKLLTGKRITDPTSGFRACSREIIEVFATRYPYDYPEPETVVGLIKSGYLVDEIAVVMNPRETGKSSIGKIRSLHYMLKVSISILLARKKNFRKVR